VKHSFFIAALNGLQDLEEELAGHLLPQVPPARDIVKQVLGNRVPVLSLQKFQFNWLKLNKKLHKPAGNLSEFIVYRGASGIGYQKLV
jgi:hypothetical protein